MNASARKEWWIPEGRLISLAVAWDEATFGDGAATVEYRWAKLQLDLEIWAFHTEPR